MSDAPSAGTRPSQERLLPADLRLPLSTIGSFPKPDRLKQARAGFARGVLDAEELRRIEREETAACLRLQESLGLDLLVDGEMYRGDMTAYFAENIEGFRISGLVRSYGNRYYRKPIVSGPVRWPRPVTVDWFRFALEHTHLPVKAILTGPYTMIDLAIRAMGTVTAGLGARTITHICYGDFPAIYPRLLDLPVDQFTLELSNSDLGLLELFKTSPFTKELGAGVLDVHSHKVEPVELVRERIAAALAVVPASRLFVNPDCGLKTRTPEEAEAKLKSMIQATREVRRSL